MTSEGGVVRTDCALLCDAATVRDGLLHVLGGGVGRVRRSQYPSRMENDLALRFALAPDEAHGVHRLEIRVVDSAGTTTSSLTGDFTTGLPDDQPVESEVFLNLPLSLRQVVVPAPGRYGIEILVDGEHLLRLPLEAAVVTPDA